LEGRTLFKRLLEALKPRPAFELHTADAIGFLDVFISHDSAMPHCVRSRMSLLLVPLNEHLRSSLSRQ
jgi:hypothetical protein